MKWWNEELPLLYVCGNCELCAIIQSLIAEKVNSIVTMLDHTVWSRAQMYRLLNYLDKQLPSLNVKRHDQLLVTRNCISICRGWAKRTMLNVFYTNGMGILKDQYKFSNLWSTLIFYIHIVIRWKIVIQRTDIFVKNLMPNNFYLKHLFI